MKPPTESLNCSVSTVATTKKTVTPPSRPPKIDRRNGGLSILEMMITVGLVALLTGLATLSISPLWHRQQLEYSTTDLVHRLELMRIRAITTRKTIQTRIVQNIFSHREKTDTGWAPWKNYYLSDRIAYQLIGFLSFYDRGFASPRTIILTRETLSQKIIININGRIRIEKGI